MKIPPALRILALWLAVTLVGLTVSMSRSDAVEPLVPVLPSAPVPTASVTPAPPVADDDVPAERPAPTAPVERTAPAAPAERSSSASLSVELPALSLSLSVDDDDILEPLSTSQCGAGYFCIWSSSNYTGSIQRFKTQSQFSSIYLSRVGSFFNNRPDRVFIYQYGGGSTSNCYAPRAKRSTTSGWLTYAESVYLSTATNC